MTILHFSAYSVIFIDPFFAEHENDFCKYLHILHIQNTIFAIHGRHGKGENSLRILEF